MSRSRGRGRETTAWSDEGYLADEGLDRFEAALESSYNDLAVPLQASILIVDDVPANLVALEATLEPLGHRVVRAASGEEALKHLLRSDFAVILMDVQMPGLDGLETAQLIKERERSRSIPIIFLTAIHRQVSNIFLGYAHGAVDYLLKPFDPEILRSKVGVFVDLYLKGEQIKRQAALLRSRELEAQERRSERRYRGLSDSIPHGIWVATPEGRVTYCNKTWLSFTGLTLEESYDLGILSAVEPSERDSIAARWLVAVSGAAPFELQVRLRRASDESYRWHMLRCAPEHDEQGRPTGWICTATDIEDHKRAEEASALLLVRAEEARQQAEEASRAKDEFLATVSHEVRTPLNAILGWSRMLRTGMLDTARATRALEVIERNAQVQTQLIEDLLDVSRIITGKMRVDPSPINPAGPVGAAVETVRPAAEAKGIQVTLALSADELIQGDPDRLQQITWNLVHNAIKFTPRGGTVEVSLQRLDSCVELLVRDSGAGMAETLIPYVFDRFRQADSTSTRVHGGLGLGLSIVRHLVELHGGTVHAESPGPGLGSTFRVRLPLRAVRAEDGSLVRGARRVSSGNAERASAAVRLDGVKVLVVDDEADVRELLTTVLEQYGAEVEAAASAAEALETLEHWRPSAILSDIGMPQQDGYAFLRLLRTLPEEQGSALPVIALTAYAGDDDARRALAAGFQRHVPKPAEPSALVAAVAEVVAASSAR